MTELPQTIAEAGQWLRGRRITSAALTEALLDRARAAQETIGAFNAIAAEPALAAARAADADFARGVDRGPLQGVPLGVKDLIATRDAPTTANSRVLDPTWGEGRDATVVRRLRAAGAVLLGKLVLPAVDQLVALAGWDAAGLSEEDRARLHRVYPALRAIAGQLRVEAVRDAEPALIYHPAGVTSRASAGA
jgi:Amidase